MRDPERDRLVQLVREAHSLTCRLAHPANHRRFATATRVRAAHRETRRIIDLCNLDALILCDNLDPSQLHELADRC